jgi:hypothetical protein
MGATAPPNHLPADLQVLVGRSEHLRVTSLSETAGEAITIGGRTGVLASATVN